MKLKHNLYNKAFAFIQQYKEFTYTIYNNLYINNELKNDLWMSLLTFVLLRLTGDIKFLRKDIFKIHYEFY